MEPKSIRFCGFGGQGIVLSSVILGEAAVTKRGLHAVQTQSYGSEARGGACQAELIVSDDEIRTPISEHNDILVAMFQTAYDTYVDNVKPEGMVIVDSELVPDLRGTSARVFRVPATQKAIELGNKLVANIVVLGYFQEKTGIISREDLMEVVRESVPARFIDLNLRAVDAGIELAKQD